MVPYRRRVVHINDHHSKVFGEFLAAAVHRCYLNSVFLLGFVVGDLIDLDIGLTDRPCNAILWKRNNADLMNCHVLRKY